MTKRKLLIGIVAGIAIYLSFSTLYRQFTNHGNQGFWTGVKHELVSNYRAADKWAQKQDATDPYYRSHIPYVFWVGGTLVLIAFSIIMFFWLKFWHWLTRFAAKTAGVDKKAQKKTA